MLINAQDVLHVVNTPEVVHTLHFLEELHVDCLLHLRALIGLTLLSRHQVQPGRATQYGPDATPRRTSLQGQPSGNLHM
jgi:hypothetical protein